MSNTLEYHFGQRQICWIPFWGISRLRRRGGCFAGAIPGDLQDYDSWYEHAVSEEVIADLAGLGFNLFVLPYSLGGTPEMEAQEHADFRHTAALCHEYGIKALPYLQYQNILQESMYPEAPCWSEDVFGKARYYASYRRTLCQSSKAFRDYIKALIRSSQQNGADGIWIDNTYLHPCFCPECRKAFAAYLKEYENGLLEDFHLIPERVEVSSTISQNMTDPVSRAYHRFNTRRNLKILSEFKAEMRTWNPHGLFASNPALHRGTWEALRGIDIFPLLLLHDIIYIENRFFAGTVNGALVGNYRGFLEAESAGTIAVGGAWKTHEFDGTADHNAMPSPNEIDLLLLEPAVFHGIIGAFWAIREMPDAYCRCGEDKRKMYFEYPPMHRALRETMDYLRTLPETGNFQLAANVGILCSQNALFSKFQPHREVLYAAEEALTLANIPWRPVWSGVPGQFAGLRLLILPDIRVLSDTEISELKKLAEEGIKILAIGRNCGLFTPEGLRRLDSPPAMLAGTSRYGQGGISRKGNFICFPDSQPHIREFPCLFPEAQGFLHRPAWIEDGTFAALVAELEVPPYKIHGKAVSSYRRKGEVFQLQLLNYDRPAQTQSITVELPFEAEGTLYSPDIPAEKRFGQVWKIKEFRRHALLEFRRKR